MPQDTPQEIFNQLADLFTKMDNTWDRVAADNGFQCNGCEDNCCLSLFYHHTQVEKAYLWHGFKTLSPQTQTTVLAKARDYLEKTFGTEGTPSPDTDSKKIPCPLLSDGRCSLYTYRPMICRMHGLPHELHRPDGQIMKGPGCDAGAFDETNGPPFNRTPFYREMAGIEMAFRTATGKQEKIRATIAHILLDE
ncbi:MAG: YkgJ family cysteine cluster protein [Desulfobacterales bacterium]|nr:YkgJ family cysteine cluster protein [Desulfobacterales bacterium]